MPLFDPESWQKLPQSKLTAVEFNPIDRSLLLMTLAQYYPEVSNIYFANCGYNFLQKVTFNIQKRVCSFTPSKYQIETSIISACMQIQESATVIIEGLGNFSQINFELKNFYFQAQNQENKLQLILIDDSIEIPLDLYPMILKLKFGIPQLEDIATFVESYTEIEASPSLLQACFGLPLGEIEILLANNQTADCLIKSIIDYKSHKLARQGLKVVPKPDVSNVGGLELLDRDLEKIATLFTPEAKARNLRPPKGCCLWGLPGTGKSLVSKMMSSRLNATLISCEWNDLLDSDLARSLAKLQYVLDIVDNVGNCVLFFDEFEKAFSGWNSGSNGGILAKMAGRLLTWMQDHESPAIMLATINHLDMLPPELIRRFGYIWFFPSEMHNGAMWEVFKLHLEKHFPGFHEQFDDAQWRSLFSEYRGCSPAEIAAAVERTHHEIFFAQLHLELNHTILIAELTRERQRFKPAITNRTTSNALAKILMEADFARPVRGVDKSRFAKTPRRLFEKKTESKVHNFDEYQRLYYELLKLDSNQDSSCLF